MCSNMDWTLDWTLDGTLEGGGGGGGMMMRCGGGLGTTSFSFSFGDGGGGDGVMMRCGGRVGYDIVFVWFECPAGLEKVSKSGKHLTLEGCLRVHDS